DRLKRWAVPLEDTSEDAVRKVLDAAEERLKYHQSPSRNHRTEIPTQPKGKKLRKGQKTPQQAYRLPILEALSELGGRASTRDVLKIIEEKMKPILIDVDYQKLPSGVDIRWRNTAQWERWALVKDGLLKAGSPDGIWELSDKGAEEIQ
ncbi:winged helix-turn-helix domain-containing protein, partial [Chloroflexota bacterium]